MTHRGLQAALAALLIATFTSCERRTDHVQALLPNAFGIRDGDPVTYLGVNVGRVSKITFTQGQVMVSMNLARSDVPLRAQDSVRIASAGLLGGLTVEIVPGPRTAPLLENQGILRPARQVGPAQVTPGELLKELQKCRSDSSAARSSR